MAPMKETSRIIIQVSNPVNNQEPTLKRGKDLWISPMEDERLWWLVVWLMCQTEVRQALLAAGPTALPVIVY